MKRELINEIFLSLVLMILLVYPGGAQNNEVVTDYDGNMYHVVTIGGQDWLEANLKVTHYKNGAAIDKVKGSASWEECAENERGAYCDYRNNSANSVIYGRLYNFFAVNDPRGLCPEGWHVASDEEWLIMTAFVGGDSIAGGILKETGLAHWTSPNTDAVNSVGFTALPGGFRWFSGYFEEIRLGGVWWTSSCENDVDAYTRYIDYQASDCMKDLNNKRHGASVRCVKD
jgi:uncharacterized protein (TIGR02145 family)